MAVEVTSDELVHDLEQASVGTYGGMYGMTGRFGDLWPAQGDRRHEDQEPSRPRGGGIRGPHFHISGPSCRCSACKQKSHAPYQTCMLTLNPKLIPKMCANARAAKAVDAVWPLPARLHQVWLQRSTYLRTAVSQHYCAMR